jgi:imidazolonepropionase
MKNLALTNIGELVTNDPEINNGQLGIIENAGVVIADGQVSWVGPASELKSQANSDPVDLHGSAVFPGFVDSHSHLVFAGERSAEFAARMSGQPYVAGGIKTTVAATRAANDESLRNNVRQLLHEMTACGITTNEIKSGYGLDTATEERSVRIAKEFTEDVTFLGAHVVAPEFADDPEGYVDLVIGQMLDACAPHSKWIDVFCDRGAFTVTQTKKILQAGIAKGLKPRIHAHQLENTGAIKMAVELDCASVDHCTHLTDEDINLLAGSDTVATLVPGAEFSTRSTYPRGRDLIDAGAMVALSTDCNPGSSYTTNMPLMIALAVREMRLTPAEALYAATYGGAQALRRTDVGQIKVGARADIVALNAPSYVHLSYRPGVPLVNHVWRSGKTVFEVDKRRNHG